MRTFSSELLSFDSRLAAQGGIDFKYVDAMPLDRAFKDLKVSVLWLAIVTVILLLSRHSSRAELHMFPKQISFYWNDGLVVAQMTLLSFNGFVSTEHCAIGSLSLAVTYGEVEGRPILNLVSVLIACFRPTRQFSRDS